MTTASPTPRVVVIGGGITGLTAAYRLRRLVQTQARPLDVLLLEVSDRLGGVIATEQEDDLLMEQGPTVGYVVNYKRLRQYDAILVMHRYVVIGLSVGWLVGSVVFTHRARQQSSTGKLLTADFAFSVLPSHPTRRGCLARITSSPARLILLPSTRSQQWLASVHESLHIALAEAALPPAVAHSAASGRAGYSRQWPCARPPD